MASTLAARIEQVILEHVGPEVGVFKVTAIDEPIAAARTAARHDLDDAVRAEVDEALAELREWLIERDPEAVERLEQGRPVPKDIDAACRVAEDWALAECRDDLSDEHRALLQSRLETMTVETLEERHALARPRISLRDANFQMFVWGAIVLLASIAAVDLGVVALAGIVGGGILMYHGFRRWRSGTVASLEAGPGLLSGGHITKRQK